MTDIEKPLSTGALGRREEKRALLRLEREKQRARGIPTNTRRAYRADWDQFLQWCRVMGYTELPVSEAVLCDYLAHLSLDRRSRRRKKGKLAGQLVEGFAYQATSIERKLSAIVHEHRRAGLPSPRTAEVTAQMSAIWRDRESRPRGSAPLLGAHIIALGEAFASALADEPQPVILRDRAALLLGWHCAMRRSEIADLKLASVEFFSEGLTVYIGRSKTDQEGKGRTLWIRPVEKHPHACPVAALRAWLEVRGQDRGALFWQAHRWELLRGEPMPAWQLVTIIDRWTQRAGIEPETKDTEFTPHSLRSGFITHATRIGRPAKETMEHSGHRSYDVFYDYVRTAAGFEATVQKGILEEE